MLADDGDCLIDLGAFSVGELGDVAFDPADEPPDPDDLLLGGGGVGAGPFVDAADGGGEPFPGAQQIIEVGGEVGEAGDIGAEVITAGAAEPDGAGAAAGLHVGRLGASAVGDCDRADGVAGVLVVEERAGVAPDPVAVPVELHRRDLVDGVAAAFLADPVVAAGDVEAAVVEELGEHVDGDARISVPLGVRVPVGVGDDAALVVSGAVGQQQRRERADPVAVRGRQGRHGHRPAAIPVGPAGGQQLQLGRRGLREPVADALLLGADRLRGGRGDGQPPSQPVGLVVVIDEHR